MSILNLARTVYTLIVIAVAALGCKLVYGYWLHKAETEAASSKSFRMDCSGRTFPDCDFTEVPVRVHTFSEIILPTVLCSAVIAVAAVFCIVIVLAPQVVWGEHDADNPS